MLPQIEEREVGRCSIPCLADDGLRKENLATVSGRQETSQAIESGGAIVAVRLGLDLADMEGHAYSWRGRDIRAQGSRESCR